jgi:hypothetical protein
VCRPFRPCLLAARPNCGLLSSAAPPGWVGVLGSSRCPAFRLGFRVPCAGPSLGVLAPALAVSVLAPLPRFFGPCVPVPAPVGGRALAPWVGGRAVAVWGLWPAFAPLSPLSPQALLAQGGRKHAPVPRSRTSFVCAAAVPLHSVVYRGRPSGVCAGREMPRTWPYAPIESVTCATYYRPSSATIETLYDIQP